MCNIRPGTLPYHDRVKFQDGYMPFRPLIVPLAICPMRAKTAMVIMIFHKRRLILGKSFGVDGNKNLKGFCTLLYVLNSGTFVNGDHGQSLWPTAPFYVLLAKVKNLYTSLPRSYSLYVLDPWSYDIALDLDNKVSLLLTGSDSCRIHPGYKQQYVRVKVGLVAVRQFPWVRKLRPRWGQRWLLATRWVSALPSSSEGPRRRLDTRTRYSVLVADRFLYVGNVRGSRSGLITKKGGSNALQIVPRNMIKHDAIRYSGTMFYASASVVATGTVVTKYQQAFYFASYIKYHTAKEYIKPK